MFARHNFFKHVMCPVFETTFFRFKICHMGLMKHQPRKFHVEGIVKTNSQFT